MKKSMTLFVLLLLSFRLFAPAKAVSDFYILEGAPIRIPESELRESTFWVFSDSIGYYESHNIWDTVNTLGYVGKYQMGLAARIETGYGNIKTSEFIKDPSIWPESEQDIAFSRYVRLNEIRLEDIISKYNDTEFDSILITKSGIIAAAHLAGFDNVRKYFERNGEYNPKDIYGTRLKDYLVRFKGYKF